MHLVTLTVPSTMSNFTSRHGAPKHYLQKLLHCQIQALRLEFFSRKPTHIMCGSSCKHDLLLEALLLSWQQSCTSPTTHAGVQAISICVIVISKLLKRYSKAKRTRAPAYSRALRGIKGGFPKGGSREAQVRIPEYQEGTE